MPHLQIFIAALAASLVACAAGHAAPADNSAAIERGRVLATAGDCVSCHSAPGGKPFAGGLMMPTPFGSISTPNITPDKETGIGAWSDDEFYRAMHDGIGRAGEDLYPVFPFPWFTKATRDDVLAIKAYLFSLAPENAPRKPFHLTFPFSQRKTLAAWRALFFKSGTFVPDPGASAEINRGAYLVEGLGHCGECHNSRNVLGASDWSGKLQGGEIEGWYAPNLTSDPTSGIGAWSRDDLARFLKTGVSPHGAVIGPMRDVVRDSLSKLPDADVAAIAAYLKSIAAKPSYKPKEYSAYDGATSEPGALAYLSHCAFCHGVDGSGIESVVPALAGNSVVKARGAQNMIRAVVGGIDAAPGLAPMPAVGAGMSDQEIADAINYARQSWGNAAPPDVAAGAVAKARADTRTLLSASLANGCPRDDQIPLAAAIQAAGVTRDLESVTDATAITAINPLIAKLKAAASGASDDQIVNALTAAYCPVVYARSQDPIRRANEIGNFAVLVYGELAHAKAK